MAIDFKFYYDQLKSTMGDKWSEEQIVEHATFLGDKWKTVKKGNNILHVDYLEGLLTSEDLEEYDNTLKEFGLELSSYDKTGVSYAFLDELTGVVRFIVDGNTTHELIVGLVGSAVWEGLCKIWSSTYNKLKGKKYNRNTAGGHKSVKDATMSVVIKIDEATSIEFNLRGDINSDKEAMATFNQMLETIKKQEPNKIPQKPIVAKADFEKQSVEFIDEHDFFQKKIDEQNKRNEQDKLNEKSKKKKQKKRK